MDHLLAGIAFSGGGIRSAIVNLGIVQMLHRRGVFEHFDYMSTVSGGGYLGSSISALMRCKRPTQAEIEGIVKLHEDGTGLTILAENDLDDGSGRARGSSDRDYRFESYASSRVEAGDEVRPGEPLLASARRSTPRPHSIGEQFKWRVRPHALLLEMFGLLDERRKWVNVSDGGHIENLACIQLLRRRCKFIVVGDAEADPGHHFNGLATLIRTARIDLGIDIQINVDLLRLDPKTGTCARHWALGIVHYPRRSEREAAEKGYVLYLKSSITGDEDEVISEYRASSPLYPHESTADQMFGEGQFEAYRSLGEHIAREALSHLPGDAEERSISFEQFARWFESLDA